MQEIVVLYNIQLLSFFLNLFIKKLPNNFTRKCRIIYGDKLHVQTDPKITFLGFLLKSPYNFKRQCFVYASISYVIHTPQDISLYIFIYIYYALTSLA